MLPPLSHEDRVIAVFSTFFKRHTVILEVITIWTNLSSLHTFGSFGICLIVMSCRHTLNYSIRRYILRNYPIRRYILRNYPGICRGKGDNYLERTLNFIKLLQYQISRWNFLWIYYLSLRKYILIIWTDWTELHSVLVSLASESNLFIDYTEPRSDQNLDQIFLLENKTSLFKT